MFPLMVNCFRVVTATWNLCHPLVRSRGVVPLIGQINCGCLDHIQQSHCSSISSWMMRYVCTVPRSSIVSVSLWWWWLCSWSNVHLKRVHFSANYASGSSSKVRGANKAYIYLIHIYLMYARYTGLLQRSLRIYSIRKCGNLMPTPKCGGHTKTVAYCTLFQKCAICDGFTSFLQCNSSCYILLMLLFW